MVIKAVSEWDCSSITIDVQGGPRAVFFEEPDTSKFENGVVENYQIILSLNDAKKLLFDLQSSIKSYEHLEEAVNNWFKENK